jgi:enoyl-CoA hydratase/carnithine racemase
VVVAGDFETSILSIAEQIAATAPLALAGHKRAIRTLRAQLARLTERVVQELIELSVAGVGSADSAEGQRAFAEKRTPRWTGQ